MACHATDNGWAHRQSLSSCGVGEAGEFWRARSNDAARAWAFVSVQVNGGPPIVAVSGGPDRGRPPACMGTVDALY